MAKQTLEQQLHQLKGTEPKSYAGAMVRHQKIKAIENQLYYLELGEEVSRKRIDQEREEISALEQEIERLSRSVEEKKQNLHFYLFGPANTRLF